VHAWTVGATWGGLQAAANFCDAFGERALAAVFRHAADRIRAAVEEHMWDPQLGRFVRTVTPGKDGEWRADPVLDASLLGLWRFGMFQPDDPRIVATVQAVRDRLWVRTEVEGLARYENDNYHQVSQDIANVPGNPWFICTLWLAQWHIAVAKTLDDLKPALDILKWCAAHALRSGVMAEQVHPYTNEPLSVSPLTWSHGTLVMVVHEYLARRLALGEDGL
jgi:GH15 family glucan-1,4-alpha-glucosidase